MFNLTGFQQPGAEGPGQQAAGDGRGDELTIQFENEIADGEFGQFAALVPEQHIVEAGILFQGVFVDCAAGGFVEQENVVGVERSFWRVELSGRGVASGCEKGLDSAVHASVAMR